MAKLKFNDILTKLSYVYGKDMFIYESKYCIGGPNSEDMNEGQIICELNSELSDVIKEEYPEEKLIFFIDIKKAKKEPNEFITTCIDEFNFHKVKNTFNKFMNVINDVKKWNTLKLSEDDVNDIFIERKLHWIFPEDSDEVNIQIAKSTFPLISEKNINDTVINYFTIKPNNGDDVATIGFSYQTDVLQINEIIKYLDIKSL